MKQYNEIAALATPPRLVWAAVGVAVLLGLTNASAAPGDYDSGVTMPGPAEAEQVNGVTFEYQRIAGSAFVPFSTSSTYVYPGSGCISKSGGSEARYAHKVVLPSGSIVKFVRMYFFDNSPGAVNAYFTTYDAAGNFTEIAVVGSSDAGGYGSDLTTEMGYVVDPVQEAVNIVANLGAQNDSSLQFCGVRIAYIPAITDRIFADGFD